MRESIGMLFRSFARIMMWIVGFRIAALLGGWWLTTRYADWRQLTGYPLLLVGALPDALFVRYVIGPKSPNWVWAMTISLILSSAAIAVILLRLRLHRSGGVRH
jgi:hypothetical protein